MATSSSTKALCKLSCRLHALININKLTTTKPPSPLKFKLQPTSSLPRVSLTSRLPVELSSSSSLDSMLPLYSAVASARLVSSLSIESLGWGLVPQGISMPL